MESVDVVGGCNVVAREGMFLVGCCSWLRSVSVYIPTECFIRTKLTFRLIYSEVFIRPYTACTKHCCVYSDEADEDCRIAVEMSTLF